jgi:hypothetical protein
LLYSLLIQEVVLTFSQHTSTATHNTCGFGKISAFFESGTLPGKDNYCSLETGPWNVTTTGSLTKRSEVLEIRERIGGLKNL